MTAKTSQDRRKPTIYIKKAQTPVLHPGSIMDDPGLSVSHVYVSGGLLLVSIATDVRFDMPDTILCRFQADESPAPPRIAYRLTADAWERIEAQTLAAIASGTDEDVRTLAIERLYAVRVFIAARGGLVGEITTS